MKFIFFAVTSCILVCQAWTDLVCPMTRAEADGPCANKEFIRNCLNDSDCDVANEYKCCEDPSTCQANCKKALNLKRLMCPMTKSVGDGPCSNREFTVTCKSDDDCGEGSKCCTNPSQCTVSCVNTRGGSSCPVTSGGGGPCANKEFTVECNSDDECQDGYKCCTNPSQCTVSCVRAGRLGCPMTGPLGAGPCTNKPFIVDCKSDAECDQGYKCCSNPSQCTVSCVRGGP